MTPIKYFLEMFTYTFARNRLLLIVSLIMLGTGMVIGFYGFVTDYKSNKELQKKREENLSYTQQLDALNNVQSSLNNLVQFVEMQKTKLKESEDLVNSLKSEQEKLKPVVEADRKTVDAILELQAQRTESGVWKERGIGFSLGVLSSIVASFIVAMISYVRKRRRNSTSETAAA
jgi:hypothetical protein